MGIYSLCDQSGAMLRVPRGQKEAINITQPLDYTSIMMGIEVPKGDGWAAVSKLNSDPSRKAKHAAKPTRYMTMGTPTCSQISDCGACRVDCDTQARVKSMVTNHAHILEDPEAAETDFNKCAVYPLLP
jgi:hypothetical protein